MEVILYYKVIVFIVCMVCSFITFEEIVLKVITVYKEYDKIKEIGKDFSVLRILPINLTTSLIVFWSIFYALNQF